MAKKKPTPENLRQGQTVYYLTNNWYMKQEHTYTVNRLFICSDKVVIPQGESSYQRSVKHIRFMSKNYNMQLFPTYRSAVRWATDRKLTIVE